MICLYLVQFIEIYFIQMERNYEKITFSTYLYTEYTVHTFYFYLILISVTVSFIWFSIYFDMLLDFFYIIINFNEPDLSNELRKKHSVLQ